MGSDVNADLDANSSSSECGGWCGTKRFSGGWCEAKSSIRRKRGVEAWRNSLFKEEHAQESRSAFVATVSPDENIELDQGGISHIQLVLRQKPASVQSSWGIVDNATSPPRVLLVSVRGKLHRQCGIDVPLRSGPSSARVCGMEEALFLMAAGALVLLKERTAENIEACTQNQRTLTLEQVLPHEVWLVAFHSDTEPLEKDATHQCSPTVAEYLTYASLRCQQCTVELADVRRPSNALTAKWQQHLLLLVALRKQIRAVLQQWQRQPSGAMDEFRKEEDLQGTSHSNGVKRLSFLPGHAALGAGNNKSFSYFVKIHDVHGGRKEVARLPVVVVAADETATCLRNRMELLTTSLGQNSAESSERSFLVAVVAAMKVTFLRVKCGLWLPIEAPELPSCNSD